MAERTIVLDPVSRVEGHLRIELEVNGNTISSARSSGTSFRGFEAVLAGRDPRDAALMTQRICGVCPVPQARAATAAFEAAAGTKVNLQGLLIRNVMEAANFIESHLLHFYLMALPDYVSGLPTAGPRQVNPRVWDGRSGLDGEALAKNLVQSLQIRRRCAAIVAVLGGKMPHPVGIVPGGASCVVTDEVKSTLSELIAPIRSFVSNTYRADVEALANAYPEYLGLGASGCAFLSLGGYPEEDGRPALSAGVVWSPNDPIVHALDPSLITESVLHGFYEKDSPRHPSRGVTRPDLNRQSDAYTWLKAPRLAGHACEVGPLARAVVAGMSPAGLGVHGRHLSRVGEAIYLAERCTDWIARLEAGASACPELPRTPSSANGVGLVEAPRGALGHWLTIEGGLISNYQIVSPTTWNGSPRAEDDSPGPMEKALENVEVRDPSDPIEAMRVVHSFDPCLQCSVH